jgi:hypothetical protein
VAVALYLAGKADRDAWKTSLAVAQHSRLMGSGMRLLTIAASKGQPDPMTAKAMQELETLVAEIEADFQRAWKPRSAAASPPVKQ